MAKIKIGWSEVGLLPDGVKIDLAGQFYERITNQVLSPLTVTALALECGDDSVIFCSCDLISVSHKLVLAIRENMKKRPDVPAEKVVASAIHTHTSLQYKDRSDSVSVGSVSALSIIKEMLPDAKYETLVSYAGEDLFIGQKAFDYVAERIAEAAIKAWDARCEGMYATGFGRAAVGLCRRVCFDDGSAKMWGDTNCANFDELEAGNDSGIELLFTYDTAKNLTGVIANIACPAQVLEHRSIISADYWGMVKERIREKYGENVYLLSLCSAAGDQCPRDMIRWVEPETPINDPNIIRENVTERTADPSMFDIKGCALIGRRVATEIFYALEDVTEYVSDTVLRHKSEIIDVPLRRVTVGEYEKAMRAMKEFAMENGNRTINYVDKARLHIHAGVVSRYRLQQQVDMFGIEVHFLRLGDIAFATNPYELFLNYGNQMRARIKARQTFLIQLCCGAYGYLPTKKAEDGSHYSAYVSSGTTGHVGGEILVRKTVQVINDMMKS